ncbi:hypothetical protein ACFE04_030879 [Oxalis oulophora]
MDSDLTTMMGRAQPKRAANIYAAFLTGSVKCDAYHMIQARPNGKALVPAKLMTSLKLLQKGLIIGRIAGSLSPIIARFIVNFGHCIGIKFQPLWIEPRSKKCVSGSPHGDWNSSWELIPSFSLFIFRHLSYPLSALACHLIWVKNGNAGHAKVSNSRGEASVLAFNEEAEKILGVSVAQKIVMLQVSTDGELRLIMVDLASYIGTRPMMPSLD